MLQTGRGRLDSHWNSSHVKAGWTAIGAADRWRQAGQLLEQQLGRGRLGSYWCSRQVDSGLTTSGAEDR
jgi:hypothetical protein